MKNPLKEAVSVVPSHAPNLRKSNHLIFAGKIDNQKCQEGKMDIQGEQKFFLPNVYKPILRTICVI